MRFLPIAVLLVACKSDPPGYTQAPPPPPAPSALDTTPLPGAPTPQSIEGWWLVEPTYKPVEDEPGNRPGNAWQFTATETRLVFGDATDRRTINSSKVEGDALRLVLDGPALLLTRRKAGLALRVENGEASIPLRRATATEVAAIDAADKKRQKMLERACTKAYDCCVAARAKSLAKENDCVPLLGPPDLLRCIQAITTFKGRAATANITIPECLPDK